MGYFVLQRRLHLFESLLVSIGTEKRKAKTANFGLHNLATNPSFEGEDRCARPLAKAGHTDCGGRFVLPVFDHSVDAVRSNGVVEPLYIRAWQAVQSVDAKAGKRGGIEEERSSSPLV